MYINQFLDARYMPVKINAPPNSATIDGDSFRLKNANIAGPICSPRDVTAANAQADFPMLNDLRIGRSIEEVPPVNKS